MMHSTGKYLNGKYDNRAIFRNDLLKINETERFPSTVDRITNFIQWAVVNAKYKKCNPWFIFNLLFLA